MNRTLRRPMFRIGGSAGTGITSGLDQPRKQYAKGSGYMDEKIKEIQMAFERYQDMGGTLPYEVFAKEFATENFNSGGRAGYQEGTPNPYASNLMPGTLPGFLTSFGLDLLSRPPQGGFLQTVAASAKGPFETFQAAEMARAQQQGERDFLSGETDRKIDASAAETDKLIASREKIAGMKDVDQNVMAYAEVFKDNNGSPNLIKGQNAVDFFDTKYNELTTEYGVESVSVEPIDVTLYQSQKNLKKFRNANPGVEGKVYFDVASGKGVKLVENIETRELKFVPVDISDEDMTNEFIPEKITPGLFNQKTKPEKDLKEVLPDFRDQNFDESIYQ